MDAVEFFKSMGLDAVKQFIKNGNIRTAEIKDELKRLVESHELVKDYKYRENGRWFFIADYCSKSQLLSPFDGDIYAIVGDKYDKAIADVEACQ